MTPCAEWYGALIEVGIKGVVGRVGNSRWAYKCEWPSDFAAGGGLSRDGDRNGGTGSAFYRGERVAAAVAGRAMAVGSHGLTLGFSHSLDLRRGGRTPWGFVGAQQRMASIDVTGSLGSGRLSLEVARDTAGHWGGVGAVALRVLRKRLRWLVRYYAPGLHSFFGVHRVRRVCKTSWGLRPT
ncbi:MAG: hypothetical protein ACJ0UT_05155 [Candidatus Latescibacterota bacterium]